MHKFRIWQQEKCCSHLVQTLGTLIMELDSASGQCIAEGNNISSDLSTQH